MATLARDILRANAGRCTLPFKATFVATYHCNFRCHMCSIWQRNSVGEMTPSEVAGFFDRWPQFSWIQLTGGELFMRRDLEDVVMAILDHDRSLFLLTFPTTGWFADRTIGLVDRILSRGIGRLMTTISLDGPPDVHDAMRGLQGSWDRAVDTYRRLRALRRRNYQPVIGMTLYARNAHLIDDTIAAVRQTVPAFERSDLHLNIGHESAHYFDNVGRLSGGEGDIVAALEAHRGALGGSWYPVRFLEDRYQALVDRYYRTRKSPLPCTALASSCFIDPYWNLFPCSIWDRSIGNLREGGFDLGALWHAAETRALRQDVVNEQCPHCWTPCEAHPTILANLVRSIRGARFRGEPAVTAAITAR